MGLKRLVTAVAVAASVGIGAVVGATIFAPSTGVAQESPTSPSASTGDGTSRGLCGVGASLEAAAEAIGIDQADLRTALQGGQTIADVAQEHGVAVDEVVDAMVADAGARIDQSVEDGRITQDEAEAKKAYLEERVTAIVNGEAPVGHGFGWHGGWPQSDGSSDDATGASA